MADKELVAGHRHQRQRRGLDQIEPLGDLRQNVRFHHAEFGVRVVRHGEHLVADGKAFHSRPQLRHGPRNVDSYQPRKIHRIEVFG